MLTCVDLTNMSLHNSSFLLSIYLPGTKVYVFMKFQWNFSSVLHGDNLRKYIKSLGWDSLLLFLLNNTADYHQHRLLKKEFLMMKSLLNHMQKTLITYNRN